MKDKADIGVQSGVVGVKVVMLLRPLVALGREPQHYVNATSLISLHSSRPFPPPTTAIEP